MSARTLLAVLLFTWPATSWAGPQINGVARVPTIAAPVAAPAPLPATGPEFFAGAKSIVDLGGEALSFWSIGLAKAQPQATIHAVNLKEVHPFIAQDIAGVHGAPNLKPVRYDMLNPPAGHPTGDRVVLNSPSFGGIEGESDAEAFAAAIDAHLEPGGLFYAQGDNLWFMSLRMIQHQIEQDIVARNWRHLLPKNYRFIEDEVEYRKMQTIGALQRRFGRASVVERELKGYGAEQLDAPVRHAILLRKPLVEKK